MKTKLLITTALVAVSLVANAYAVEDLIVNETTKINNGKFNEYQNIQVQKGSILEISSDVIPSYEDDEDGEDLVDGVTQVRTTGNTDVKGTLNITNSVLEAGNDMDELPNNSNILLDGASVTMVNSDLEANGNITIKDTNLTSKTTAGEGYGIWADGSLIIDGDSKISLDNSYIGSQGDLVIKGGTHKYNGLDASSGIHIVSGGAINVTKGQAYLLRNGDIGKIIIPENAVLEVKDNASSKGTMNLFYDATIDLAGKLVSNIDGDDRGLIIFENSNAVVDGNVDTPNLTFSSSHSLSKAITGTLGSVNKLTVAKGTLNFDKDMEDTITTVEVASGATLDIGLKTLHSGGDKEDGEGVIFADNSTLKFTATSAEKHGQIKANYVNISENGTTLDMTFNGTALAEGESMDIQLFDQSKDMEGVEIEGKFAKLTSNSRYDFAAKGDGVYTVIGVHSASDIVEDAGGSANNVAAAEAWDNIDTSKVDNQTTVAVAQKLATLSNSSNPSEQKAYIDALTAVAPDVAPAVQQTSSKTANQVFGAVGTRLSGGSVASGRQGMSSGDNPFHKVAVWIQGLFNKSELDDTSKAKGFDSDTYGTAFGIEKNIDNNLKAGVGYTYSQTDINGFMRDTDVDTHTAIVYGEYKPSNWYVNGIASYGWSDYSEDKNVAGVGVKADYDVETFGLQVMTGYEYNINGYDVTPETGLRYVYIKQDGYKDSADQRVSGSDSDILTGVIGAKVSKNFELENGMNIRPEARLAATYDLMNDDVNSVVTLANGSAYSVKGEALDRFGMEFGAGVTAEVNDKVEVSLGYEGKFREDYKDHTGLLNAKYKF